MQYAIAAAALFAGAAFAAETATVYDTEIHTVTSCGPEVTNCPARSTWASESKPTGYWGPESSAWAESSAPVETSSWVESTTVSTWAPEVTSSVWVESSSWVESTTVPVAPYPTASTEVPAGPTASAPSASGTGVWGSTPSSPVPYTGAAASVKAAGLLIGAGALAAFFL
nr:hypothetical protein CFP56_11430 [Quercus suber]